MTTKLKIDFGNKDRFHSTAKTVLRKLAKQMGLEPGSYEVRSNKGGPAIMGEAFLHAEGIYIMIPGDYGRSETMFRSCAGRKDYTGGANHWIPTSVITNCPEVAVDAFRSVMQK